MVFGLAFAAWAQEPAVAPAPPDPYRPELERWLREIGTTEDELPGVADAMLAFDHGVAWQTGEVSVKGGDVVLTLGDADRYAPPADADRILQAWGNPSQPDTLGLLFPDHAHAFGPGAPVVITASDDGWVDDGDAATIDAAPISRWS
jgi:uncharacterized membrane-anchored protein